jgi:glutamyl-tRNA synthetase
LRGGQSDGHEYLITIDKFEEGDNYGGFLTPQKESRTEALADENAAAFKTDDIIQWPQRVF